MTYVNGRGQPVRGPVKTQEHRKEFNAEGTAWAKRRAAELLLIHGREALYGNGAAAAKRGIGRAFELARQHGFEAELDKALDVILSDARAHVKELRAAVRAALKEPK